MEKTFWMVYLMAIFSAMLFVHLVSAWDYHNESKNWAIDYPSCGGRSQSPISIEHKHTKYIRDSQLTFQGYINTLKNVTMKNTGNTVAIELKGNKIAYVRGLDGKYIAYEVHFHWGMSDLVGSEHMLNGHRFPMEVHILHYLEKYHNSEKASQHKKGLLAVAYFIEGNTPYENLGLTKVVRTVKMVKFKGNKYPVSSWKLEAFLPVNQTCYYSYEGSLTYPPCLETVIWIVYKDALHMSTAQMNEFRSSVDELDESAVRILMGNNFRPLQELNDRIVCRSCDPFHSDVTSLSWSAVLLMLCQVGIFMDNSYFWYLVLHKYRPTEW